MPEQRQTESRKIKAGVLYRSIELDQRDINAEARTVDLAFSSEAPVDRWFGQEVLDHNPGSVRMDRLTNGGPVLKDHNTQDHIGVVESARIDTDRRGRAVVRIGKSAKADELFNDITDGIARHVSVGYRVHKAVLEETGDGPDVYRVTDWEPLEISFVAVPADASVGVGRADGGEENMLELIRPIEPTEDRNMPDKDIPAAPAAPAAPAVDIDAVRNEARQAEQERARSIIAIGERFDAGDLAREYLDAGKSVSEFNEALLQRMGGTGKHPAVPDADIGMSEREAKTFSFVRAINALANPTDRKAQEAAAFEFEASEAAQQRSGVTGAGIRVPADVLKRDLVVGTSTAGGHTVSTDLLASSFIDVLRNRMVVAARATQLTDLNGNIAIPRQTGGATAYWVAESGAPTESQQAFDQVTLSPNTVGAFTDFSRKMMLQSSIDVEAFVRGDLAAILALEVDRVCINGSGASNQPTGILNTTGIGDVAGGTNGAAPTWANIVALESDVAAGNADVGQLAYVVNAVTRGKLKTTARVASTDSKMIWGDGAQPLNGYDALVTNQVPGTLTKGTGSNLSAIIFGNFADLVLGMWGGLDLTVDPYTGSTTGTVRVVALQDVDVAVRHAASFSAMQDAITV